MSEFVGESFFNKFTKERRDHLQVCHQLVLAGGHCLTQQHTDSSHDGSVAANEDISENVEPNLVFIATSRKYENIMLHEHPAATNNVITTQIVTVFVHPFQMLSTY